MYLNELFDNTPSIEIKQLSIDSRVPMKDCIFFCLSGIRDDGHEFIAEAIKNGASVIVYEEDDVDTKLDAIYIKVSDVADCLNHIASKFYNYPADKLETYIIVGCNGKTSINYILTKLLNNFKKVGSIGSNGIFYGERHLLNKVPTLTILDNQKYLNEFVKSKIEGCVLEANAMSLSYKKLDSITPNVFIYTNTNEYSTDYEEIEKNYFDSIRRYIYTLDDNTNILLNSDDISYEDIKSVSGKNCYSYGFNSNSDYLICDVILNYDGSSFSIRHNSNVYKIKTKLLGINNIYNLTSAIAAIDIMNYDINEISVLSSFIDPLEGIIEPINNGQNYHVIVDNAQNIYDVSNIVKFANRITSKNDKIYIIWGLDYSDDKESTELFLDTVKDYVDNVIICDGNTYRGSVLSEVSQVFKNYPELLITIISDRSIAIESTIELLNKDDTLLILGKGRDKYIINNMGKHEYDGDSLVAKKSIKRRMDEEKMLF